MLDASILPERSVQRIQIAVEEEGSTTRCSYPLAIYDGDLRSTAYMNAVYRIALEVDCKHADYPVNTDSEHYDRRRKYGYKQADSLYDAYLIGRWNPRPEFDYQTFTEAYPDWEEKGRAK